MSKYKSSDDSHTVWGRSNDSRSDEYSAKTGSSSHCHLYNNKETGERGVVHRGDCKVCDDNSSGTGGSDGGGFFGWLFGK